jgi:hypothetical protein
MREPARAPPRLHCGSEGQARDLKTELYFVWLTILFLLKI